MSFVAAAATVGGAVGLTGTAAVIGGGALIGAGVGGTYSALTGDGNILDSMLTGATIGGLGGWGLSAAGVGGAAAGTAGTAGAGGAGTAGAGTLSTAAETAAASSPALNAYGPPSSAMMGAPEGLAFGPPESAMMGAQNPSWWSALSGGEKLGVGLGATTLMGLLGGQPEMEAVPTDKGTIRPYQYSSTRRDPAEGESYYFEPIEYDKYGQTTKPLDTSEKNYFNQNYTPLPTYAAANGGSVPQLDNMPRGGLASLQGMRDGYGASQTMDGNIPQFALGGLMSKSFATAKADDGLPRYSFDPETRKYTRLNAVSEQPQEETGGFSPFRGGIGNMIKTIVNQVNPSQQNSGNKFSYDQASQRYEKFSGGGETGMENMRQERAMPDQLRDMSRMRRMAMLESSLSGDEQAKASGGQGQDFMFMPGGDLKNMYAMAMMNEDLSDDLRLKLMAAGYKNPAKSGIANIGAGLTKKLDKDSELSAYYEQSPSGQDKSYGARYSKRFNTGGIADGHLGGYSDGGQLLKGPGDGVSDDIPASINNKQPARLADGEFVIPARIVSELGNGSTDAGAKRLYDMMDRIQSSRSKTVGKGKVAVDSKARKHLPA